MTYFDTLLQRSRIHKAVKYIPRDSSILDIGTADGSLFRAIPEVNDSVGIDMNLDYENLPGTPHVMFLEGMFPQILPPSCTFDIITMLATLEHIPPGELESLAANCAKYLRSGGRLIITVPSPFVDKILIVLQGLHLIHGMSTEQHYGFDVRRTPAIFVPHGFKLQVRRRFQLGLNNLFVFERNSHPEF